MTEAKPFAALIGPRLRARRHELGLSQDEVARRTWPMGFSFTRGVIDAIERGTRSLDYPELKGVLAVLGLNEEELLRDAGQVALDRGISVRSDTLLGVERTWRVTTEDSVTAVVTPSLGAVATYGGSSVVRGLVGVYSDAEVKAARRLGVSPAAVMKASESVWGRSLDEEREERVRTQAPEKASPRTLQAVRGHVTRSLLDELRPVLAAPRRRGRGKDA
jgi:transcriptional regulator with XRE-family HTH domain